MRRSSSGFTIVELMVAMVIFMIICAIAIPSYMSATQRAHEAVAVSFLRQIQTGQEAYRLNSQQYADTFAKLQPYVSADLVEPALPEPGFGLTTVAYAEPLPPNAGQGNGGSGGGQGGSNPGNSGSAPGQTGSNPGQGGGTPPGQGGSAPGQSGSSSGSTGSSSSSGNSGSSSGTGTAPSDSKVYSMYIFQLTLSDPLHWSCSAEPVRDRTNSKFYFTDQTNIVRYAVGSIADSLSPQL
jgi:type II secretory pathway pseudopilin PulG